MEQNYELFQNRLQKVLRLKPLLVIIKHFQKQNYEKVRVLLLGQSMIFPHLLFLIILVVVFYHSKSLRTVVAISACWLLAFAAASPMLYSMELSTHSFISPKARDQQDFLRIMLHTNLTAAKVNNMKDVSSLLGNFLGCCKIPATRF